VITLWFVIFMRYHDALYRLHSKRFKLAHERFDSIHYAGMAFYKIGTKLVNLAPYLAIYLVT
jgi:hypothetical protein